MSKNIFKTEATSKNNSIKVGNNNSRFSSLKDELNEKPSENIVTPKKEKIPKEKSRFNFDNDEVNVFTSVENNPDDIRYEKEERYEIISQNNIRTYNSFTTLKPPVIKPAEVVPLIYSEELFPELTLKKTNEVKTETISFADKLKSNKTDVKKEEVNTENIEIKVDKITLVEKLKSRYKEDNEENNRKQEEKRIKEEKDYVKPGWVYFRKDPNTKKWHNYYGDNTRIVVREKTLNEHMNYWIYGVVDRYLTRKEMLETDYGITDDYSPPEENNIEYFDMLDEKAERERAKEEEEIINKYLNDNEDDYNDDESYSNDYWKKR